MIIAWRSALTGCQWQQMVIGWLSEHLENFNIRPFDDFDVKISRNSRWSSDDCLNTVRLSSFEQDLEISSNSRWPWNDYQNINGLSIHDQLIIMIRRSAETANDHQIITSILIIKLSTDDHGLKIRSDSTAVDSHQMITRTLTN